MIRLGSEAWQTLAVIAAPILFHKGIQLYRRRHRNTLHKKSKQEEHHWLTKQFRTSLLLLLATYNIVRIACFTPISLFSRARLPLNSTSALLHERLLSATGNPLSDDTLMILTRLKTYAGRVLYMHVGSDPLLLCDVCTKPSDYQLFMLPSIVLQYTFFASAVGLLTLGQGREPWRAWTSVALGAGLFAEGAALFVSWDKELFLPTCTHLARHLLFLLVSIAAFVLPPHQGPDPILAPILCPLIDQMTHQQVDNEAKISLASIQRTAIMRNTSLRQHLISFWDMHNKQDDILKADPKMKALEKELELDTQVIKAEDETELPRVVEGSERASAREWVQQLMKAQIQRRAGPGGGHTHAH